MRKNWDGKFQLNRNFEKISLAFNESKNSDYHKFQIYKKRSIFKEVNFIIFNEEFIAKKSNPKKKKKGKKKNVNVKFI